jgi:hypothetical protein
MSQRNPKETTQPTGSETPRSRSLTTAKVEAFTEALLANVVNAGPRARRLCRPGQGFRRPKCTL